MSGVLIVVYSQTGHTRTLAHALARKLDAEVAEIEEVKPRTGRAFLRGWLDSALSRKPSIKPIEADPSAYDLIVLAAPVWSNKVAAPLRTYVGRRRKAIGEWALLLTHDSAELKPGLAAELGKRIKRPPRVVLDMMSREVDKGAFDMKLDIFAKTLASV